MTDLSQMSMLDLFRLEVGNQAQALTKGLLALERDPAAADALQSCMRAAHSLKGAARIVGLDSGVGIAHAMEELLVAAQRQRMPLGRARIDGLLRGVDLLERMARLPEVELAAWANAEHASALDYQRELQELPAHDGKDDDAQPAAPRSAVAAAERGELGDRVLRLTAENVERLLGLASESLVESRGLKPFAGGMQRLKRLQLDAWRSVDALRQALGPHAEPAAQQALSALQAQLAQAQELMARQLLDLDLLDRRAGDLSRRLYDEALACRMRPFADGVQALPRLVRDIAHSLGKQARLDIAGEATAVDRDMLERLEAPLGHLLRNAVDHGIETPDERRRAGKPEQGVVRLEARHAGGLLQVSVSDDGAGIDLDALRAAVVARRLAAAEVAARLSDAELLEFLFLPGFSLREAVTQISGRGVGLDVVQDMVRQVRGSVRISSQRGQGTRFSLQLPLTLSVIRALLVQIGAEAYAFPLGRIVRALRLARADIAQLEGRPHFAFENRRVGLVAAHQVLGSEAAPPADDDLAVVVIGEHGDAYGLVVDRFLGERELVVQPLDPRLGKVQDVSAGALADDGSVVLVLDIDDLLRSLDKLVSEGRLAGLRDAAAGAEALPRKRVLVVDDSLTVRELQRKLLEARGLRVEIAVDGMEGWNAVRTGHFDLVITDIDMPRLDGIELVKLIRNDPHLKATPVMIVSYKDRESDRQRGLDAGADYYLTKGSFHDESLLQAVADLIGEEATNP
ncbi:hybrid sensor histidine kinase/response regulator [Caldimonas sp. KR1-144]|uniref:hybrid sensor histidine kinase/response regulator n=1 Tax=Caldimonas sp. KR1-144 TaxID=3400911 RepID=UPI003C0057D6